MGLSMAVSWWQQKRSGPTHKGAVPRIIIKKRNKQKLTVVLTERREGVNNLVVGMRIVMPPLFHRSLRLPRCPSRW